MIKKNVKLKLNIEDGYNDVLVSLGIDYNRYVSILTTLEQRYQRLSTPEMISFIVSEFKNNELILALYILGYFDGILGDDKNQW